MTIPFYDAAGVRIFHGDARAVFPTLDLDPDRTVVVTDPVWPDAPEGLFPGVVPVELFGEVAAHFPQGARRVVVHLGCKSDPRFLSAVPAALPFVRTCWLRYSVPSRRGTILIGSDVAYVFGDNRPLRPRRVFPGETTSTGRWGKGRSAHPCPRTLDHVAWLVDRFTTPEDVVVDPFCGSGTTLRAAKDAGREAVGIEIKREWCEEAVRTLRQETLDLGGAA